MDRPAGQKVAAGRNPRTGVAGSHSGVVQQAGCCGRSGLAQFRRVVEKKRGIGQTEVAVVVVHRAAGAE